MKFPSPLIFIIQEEMIHDELYIPSKDSKKYNGSKDYLIRLKTLFDLPYSEESLLSIIEEKKLCNNK